MTLSTGSLSGDVGFAAVNLQVNLLAISLAVISESLALRRYKTGILIFFYLIIVLKVIGKIFVGSINSQ